MGVGMGSLGTVNPDVSPPDSIMVSLKMNKINI
jgi:hypothetical protein